MPRDDSLLEPVPEAGSAAGGQGLDRRILAIWLPSLPTDRLRRRLKAKGRDPAQPLVLIGEQNGRLVIAALDRAAAAEGIRLGMPVTDARALVPEIAVMEARPEADARALAGLADWATRYTPWTAPSGMGGLFLDISGCAHLFGGEAALLADAARRLEGFGYAARLAIADSPGAAWAMARSGPHEPERGIVPPGQARRVLGPLSVEGLRLPGETLEALRRLGLHRIGDLAGLPRGSVTKRFGDRVLLRLDQALGHVGEPISPSLPVIPHAVRLAFAEPIGRKEDVSAALERLLERLCKGLEEAREGARRLSFALYRVDGAVIRREVGTARPVRDPRLLARLFAEKLDDIDAGFGFETLVLSAPATQRLELAQASLSEQAALRAADALANLSERAAARFGPGSVSRLAPRQSHLPERAVISLPLEAQGPGRKNPYPGGGWPAEWRRPIHLFAEPQPIEAVAPIPDDPPVMFRWRGQVHPIALAEGPERIAPEWWLGTEGPAGDRPRDYYRVEDAAGCRYWLFRHGLYGRDEDGEGEGERPPPQWFLHGLFG